MGIINGAFLRPIVPRSILGPVVKEKSPAVKFVDDSSLAVSVNLKQYLMTNLNDKSMPFFFLPTYDNNFSKFYSIGTIANFLTEKEILSVAPCI